MPVNEQHAAVFNQLKQALQACEPPTLSHSRFDTAHEQFERSSNQQGQILDWLCDFCGDRLEQTSTDTPAAANCFRVLSIGCGSGILDNPLIQTMASITDGTANPMFIEYTGVDPNPVACARFRKEFAALQAANVQLRVCEDTVETMEMDRPFDLVHVVHALYYLSDPAASIDGLIEQLSALGKLIIFQAPKAELNQLADCFWTEHPNVDIWFSGDLEQHLRKSNLQFSMSRINASVNVTACFDPACEDGKLIMDFITQVNCESLESAVRRMVLDYLAAVGQTDDNHILVPHPVDVFVVQRGES